MHSQSSTVFPRRHLTRIPLIERMERHWRKQTIREKLFFFICFLSAPALLSLAGIASKIIDKNTNDFPLWEAITLLTVSIVLLATWRFSNRLLGVLKNVNRAAERFSLGDYDVRIDACPNVRCWEILGCKRSDCPAFGNDEEKCWFVDNTLCTGTLQERFPNKIADCRNCRVYKTHSGDELISLVDSFNNAVHRLRHSARERQQIHKQMLQHERLSTLGETVAGIAHSIKNILGMIKGGEYLIESGLSQNLPDRTREGWEMVKNGNRYISDLVVKMLTLCREHEPQYEEIELSEVVDSVLAVMQTKAQSKKIRMVAALDDSMPRVVVDAACMREALINLTDNALDACEADRGVVTIGSNAGTNGLFDLYVEDNGPGIPPEIQSQALSPFFSTKGEKGTGLGLAVTDKIVSEHGGEIDIQSGHQGGCRVVMRLPILDRPPNQSHASLSPIAHQGSTYS
ncbi:MAG: hypothetical protein JXR73_16055 [Candidatus Omnitrophica bacterium]|nr:hypothetical protein [Candidatus Omnitrophota bacterium]